MVLTRDGEWGDDGRIVGEKRQRKETWRGKKEESAGKTLSVSRSKLKMVQEKLGKV